MVPRHAKDIPRRVMPQYLREDLTMTPQDLEKTKKSCEERDLEKRVREAIVGIVAKLNRSDLSADAGHIIAKQLMEAYEHLKSFG